jgi:hypothetical protein
MYGRLQSMSVQRPARSYSEPIVKFEGSSALNGDILSPEALLLNRNSTAGAITKTPSSNASSRSNSIVQAPFLGPGSGYSPDNTGATGKSPVTLGNIPWLSSPPSNPLDPTGADFGLQLPPATEQKTDSAASANRSSGGNPYSAPAGPPGIVSSNGMWFPPQQQQSDAAQQQQQQQAFQQAAMQQQFMGGPFGGMMYMNPYMPAPPPGVVPSPDAWAAMISSHAMQEQIGMPQGQYPGQPFMMPQFPFFNPEAASAMGFGHGTPAQQQQQQMMYFSAQQQLQALQQMHYQNQAQAMALAAAQAQMQAQGHNPAHNAAQAAVASNEQHKGIGSSSFPYPLAARSGPPGAPPGILPAVSAPGKTSENTESDDLFHFHELNLDSPAFDPKAPQTWMPAGRR